VAFDKLTGEVRWQATDELASYASPVVAEIEGRKWCFVFARGGLVALDPQTGAVDFQFPWRAAKLESVNASSPVVVGDEVFISESYGPGSALIKVKPGGYDVAWQDSAKRREKAMELHWNTAVYHDGHLYASSGQYTNMAELRCVEWATGKVKWAQGGLGRSSLLFVNGRLLCLSEDGTLQLLNCTPEKYEPLADLTPTVAESLRDSKQPVDESLRDSNSASRRDAATGSEPLLTAPAWVAPVLSHGLLYVRGNDRLVCLELLED
jgi:outer membrane protein assembly factor BamB